ncbi:hypothetical protein GE09DRAFT_132634 [Coniochaeta sp. 2T2.1]|nr:hypothetical protein GE09DRAFT_132634 [Coniochaeta sp. 2T2.1]
MSLISFIFLSRTFSSGQPNPIAMGGGASARTEQGNCIIASSIDFIPILNKLVCATSPFPHCHHFCRCECKCPFITTPGSGI